STLTTPPLSCAVLEKATAHASGSVTGGAAGTAYDLFSHSIRVMAVTDQNMTVRAVRIETD
ncbi:MAG: hypothetical protein WCI20_14340, partial [bacterium]